MIIPSYWREFIEQNKLAGEEITITPRGDRSGIGAELEILDADANREELEDAHLGVVVAKDGFILVANCLLGTGDPYFINRNDGPEGPLYRIYHDRVSAEGYDRSKAVDLVLEDQREIANYIGGMGISYDLIRNGRIVQIDEEFAWFDIGCKFESPIPLTDWNEHEVPPKIGDECEVMIDDDLDVDDRPLDIVRVDTVRVRVIPRPEREFETIIAGYVAGQTYSGEITRRLEDGFLVNIGLPVFLPDECAEPVMLEDPKPHIGQERAFRITKIDRDQRQIQVELA